VALRSRLSPGVCLYRGMVEFELWRSTGAVKPPILSCRLTVHCSREKGHDGTHAVHPGHQDVSHHQAELFTQPADLVRSH
jgi:hypothetical protein